MFRRQNCLLIRQPNSSIITLNPTGKHRMASKKKVLVTDDDKNIRLLIRHNLESAGFDVDEAENGEIAKNLVINDYDAVLLDLQMPVCSGREALQFYQLQSPDTQCIIISAVGVIDDAVQAMSEGAFWYIQKPFDPDELVTLVNKAIEVRELKSENKILKQAISEVNLPANFVSHAASTEKIVEQVKKIANLDSTILITGPSGTGKSTLARLIHHSSERSEQAFVSVSCAALPRDLLEAELFGYEKGSFTGAVNSRPGKIEVADGGTLFLDEIGDMPLELQPKLLTFLQDRVVQRIGSNKDRKFDVRIITATHQDLVAMCKERTFREDLFYRINVLSLQIPSLAERYEDLRPLTDAVLKRIAERRMVDPFSISNAAFKKLRSYDWPGNVRELENVLERATAFSESHEIQEDDINLSSSLSDSSSRTGSFVGLELEEIEKRAIIETLEHCEGNKQAAADMLGVSQKSIYNKINKYDIKLK